MSRPSVLVVHGWEGYEGYLTWVLSLANRLQADGVEVRLEPFAEGLVETDAAALEQLAPEVDYVVLLLSPTCNTSRWQEQRAVLGRIAREHLVPVLAAGYWQGVPEELGGSAVADLRQDDSFEEEYAALLQHLLGAARRTRGEVLSDAVPGLAVSSPPGPPLAGVGGGDLRGELSTRLRRGFAAADEPLAAESGAEPETETENVQVTTVVPGAVKPGARFTVEVVLHVEGFEVEAGDDRRVDAGVATLPLAEGARLTVRLVSVDEDVFSIDDPEAPLVWGPPSRRAAFRLRAAKTLEGGIYDLRAELWCEGVQLARSYLEIAVDRGSLADTSLPKVGRRPLPRSAFASYARRDRAAVAARIDSLKAVGIDVFLDSLDIRQGTDWRQVLEDELLSRDALLLFWSSAASASEWVEREWRYALERRGLDSILPNALEPPAVCPPPPELASLQFGSVLTELAAAWRQADGS